MLFSFTDTLFFDIRLPSVSELGLSDNSLAIVLEVTFWGALVHLYKLISNNLLRSHFSKKEFWNEGKGIKTRGGIFLGNAQDDIVLMIITGVHHLTAGLICAYGSFYQNTDIWRHGYLLEVGFEVADLLAIIFKAYPHRKWDNVKPDVQAGMIFHHLPGILVSGLILNADLHYNGHIQALAMWMLLGGAGSLFAIAYLHLLDLTENITQATAFVYLNMAFFFFARWYIFPMEAYNVIQDVQANPSLAGTWSATLLSAAGICLGLFNTAMLVDLIPKTARYTMRMLDGVTPVDSDEVPPSWDDRSRFHEAPIKPMNNMPPPAPKQCAKARTWPKLQRMYYSIQF